MNVLNAKRGRVKTTITNIGKYVASLSQHSLREDIKIRLSKLEIAMQEFYVIIDQINELADNDDFVDQTKEVEDIEDRFYDYSTKLRTALAEFDKNVVYDNNIESSSANFQQLLINQSTFLEKLSAIQSKPIETNLPKINIPSFDGDRTQWKTFADYFISTIHRNERLSNVQKFHYLRSSLVRNSEAEGLIQHISVTEANYPEAWNKLSERYDVKTQIVTLFIKAFMDQPSINRASASSIRQLCDKSDEIIRGLHALGDEAEARDNWLIYIIVSKLDPETRKQWCYEKAEVEFPAFSELIAFLNRVALSHEINQPEKSSKSLSDSKPARTVKVHQAQGTSSCPICQGVHRIYSCETFHLLDIAERRARIAANKLCFNCLSGGHAYKNCNSNSSCRICRQKHHTMLHSSTLQLSSKPQITEVIEDVTSSNEVIQDSDSCSSSTASQKSASQKSAFTTNLKISLPSNSFKAECDSLQSILPTAIVAVKMSNGQFINARALLDSGSEATFVSESLIRKLGIARNHCKQLVTGLANKEIGITKGTCTLQVTSKYKHSFEINALILTKISGSIPSTRININLQFANKLQLADPEFMVPNAIDILIGADYFFEIMLSGKIVHPSGYPIAQETKFGWIVCGKAASEGKLGQSCFTTTLEIDRSLQRFWEIENVTLPKTKMSSSETAAEQHFGNTFIRHESGRYIVRLPFKDGTTVLGNSIHNALARLRHMERKFNRNEHLRSAYVDFMAEYLSLKHMEIVPKDEITSCNHYYLPHHAVIKESSSTTKLRVVFDASCKSDNGRSLNDILHIGPQLQDDLFTLLVRFRCHRFAFTADAGKMFRQVVVHPEDRDYQRIIWRDNPKDEIIHYRLTTVTYGTAPGSYLAIRALRQLAFDEEQNYPNAAKIILNDFYVDDMMSGSDSESEAIMLFHEIVELLSRGGFNMRKWASNSKKLMKIIPTNLVEPQLVQVSDSRDLSLKVLGISWSPHEDTFMYNVCLPDEIIATKRQILSDSARIFDPLGWAAPVIIRAKILFQELWIHSLDWDEEIPSTLKTKWIEFRKDLGLLTKLRVQRWLPTQNHKFELHAFCDASEAAYSAVVYIRSFVKNRPVCNIIAAKTRVAPLKQISLPRLELSGALLLCNLVKSISEALHEFKFEIFAWTDSTIVLSWLSELPRSWKTFIANRCSEILEVLPRSSWNHIKGSTNPADCASRGISAKDLIDNNLWWHGPEFLQDVNFDLKSNHGEQVLSNSNAVESERKSTSKIVNIAKFTETNNLFERFSSFDKLIRVTARVLRFLNIAKKRKCFTQIPLSTTELSESRNCLLKLAQWDTFNAEISSLQTKKRIKLSSSILSLAPVIDGKGILRVGGRLQHSTLKEDQKHPIILSGKHPISNLIVHETHQRYLHAGTNFIMAQLKQKYWIVGARNLIRKIVRSCTTCRRYSADGMIQIMGELPSYRVQSMRPFLKVGCDFAGPVNLRMHTGRNARYTKAYIALFVCLSTKAIHLEVVSDLSTDAFIAAFKRFCGRRGIPSDIFSDNGTNFVGSNRILSEDFKLSVNQHNQIVESFGKDGTNWHFIPPAAPNFGGIWEAGVKSTKHHLKRVIKNHILTFEELSTLLAQIEAVLNSRPVCISSSDDIDPLTPGHFLIGQPLTLVPEPDLEHLNITRLSRWQLVQSMMQGFWKRWHSEYLTQQQQRVKWRTAAANLHPGDVVIIKESNLPPGKWCLGKISECHPGEDGHTRVVSIKCKGNTIKRPITKLVKLFDDCN